MRTKITYFTLGLAVGLLAWFVFDRVAAYRYERIYEEAMTEYEQADFLAKPPAFIHQEFLDLQLTDLSGKSRRLGDLVGDSSKPAFINLWATWCRPCVAEMPSIERLCERMGKDVAFFILSNEGVEKLAPFVEKRGWSLPIYSYGGEKNLPAAMKGKGVPRTYVVHDGEVKLNHLGAAPWDSEKAVNFFKGLLNGTPDVK